MTADASVETPILIEVVGTADWPALEATLDLAGRAALAASGVVGKRGQSVLIPAGAGAPRRLLFVSDGGAHAGGDFRALAARHSSGRFRLERPPPGVDGEIVALAWAAGAYRFERYKQAKAGSPSTLEVAGLDAARAAVMAEASALCRDMINTPASDMGPAEMEAIARDLAHACGASIMVTSGQDLLDGYPAVHAVGRAADASRTPRMVELSWGEAGRPLVAIVGKGVAFDTGGLDIKPSAGMRWMKKDMGGAAHALALATMVMRLRLPVRLCVLTPLVENAISGAAMRPGDILATRRGLSVEVGNTDAEGRLILADALTRAGEMQPDLTIDLATLTGAARVALGPEVIPFYTDDDALASALQAASTAMGDPIWRMPLWDGYAAALDSDVADLKNDADAWAQAGSITAALFLKRFAPPGSWVHFDLFAWNARSRPGWPQGAETQAIAAVFAMLEARYRR